MTPLTPELAQRHQRAADYLVRRREPEWTPSDERELDAWLDHPANRTIFDSLSRTALDLQQIRRPQLASEKASARTAATLGMERVRARNTRTATTPLSAEPSRWQFGRRALAPALMCGLLLAGGGWYWWDSHPDYELIVATGQGDIREIELPDGSSVALNFGSSLRVRYYPRHRDTELLAGEAFFRVAPDASRPFIVDSGNSQVRVVGTAFNVLAAPPGLVVKVLEGQVEVRPDRTRADMRPLRLNAGEGVSINSATRQHATVAAPADTVGDWRGGQLVFEQTPLATVASDLARYLGEPVTVEGERLGRMPVSGMAITSSPATFLRSLPDLLPVQVDKSAEGVWRISARS